MSRDVKHRWRATEMTALACADCSSHGELPIFSQWQVAGGVADAALDEAVGFSNRLQQQHSSCEPHLQSSPKHHGAAPSPHLKLPERPIPLKGDLGGLALPSEGG
jgi:hypothetical protein